MSLCWSDNVICDEADQGSHTAFSFVLCILLFLCVFMRLLFKLRCHLWALSFFKRDCFRARKQNKQRKDGGMRNHDEKPVFLYLPSLFCSQNVLLRSLLAVVRGQSSPEERCVLSAVRIVTQLWLRMSCDQVRAKYTHAYKE